MVAPPRSAIRSLVMEVLFVVIASWLSVNFGLPEVADAPDVRFVTAQRMLEVRLQRLADAGVDGESVVAQFSDNGDGDFHALYDDVSATIYLPETWSSESDADVSVLVHEMVHHIQNVSGLTYACVGERERPAYRAQARWLKARGATLEDAFGLDPMTVFVRTNCWS